MQRSSLVAVLLASLWGLPALAAQNYVWWEAEAPIETNLVRPVDMRTPGHLNAEQQSKLSEGRWLTFGPTEDGARGRARYAFEVAFAGTYSLYVRKFWKHGPFRWRFDDHAWRECGRDVALLDSTYLQQHWGANWVALGEVELAAGERRFEIESIDDKGCIDCFLLIDGPFAPRGKLKPGAKTGAAMEGFFAWEPDLDPLDGSSPLDLRYLNEERAGGAGPVRRKGDGFVLGSGTPVRFWMVQAGLANMQHAQVDRWARRLSKYGVNLVRMQFSDFFALHVEGRDAEFAAALDRVHYVVAALAKEGIYSYFGHLYWHTHDALPAGIIEGFDGKKAAVALPYFAPEFQELYHRYAKALFEPENPYTGRSLAAEPALAFVEINNESSLLFHTFAPERFDPAELALVERSFGEWARKRYGSLNKAVSIWGRSRKHTPDRLLEGRLGLYSAGFLGGESWAVQQRNPARASDQLQWMVESMRDYYDRMQRLLKNDVRVHALITASNWKTSDERVLGGLERHVYTVTDAVLRNSYFSTRYPNPQAQQKFYAVELGDTFGSVSSLAAPMLPGPLATPLLAGHPFMVTENNWTRPNAYRAEWPVLVASYGSMLGIDGWCFFSLDQGEWQTTMGVWDLNNPTILGQFPATALMYRRGDVAPATKPAVVEKVALADVFALKGTKAHAVEGKDALWVAAIGEKEGKGSRAAGDLDPRAFFVGPVEQTFHDGPGSLRTVELSRYIDSKARTITSTTGELRWNYGTGLLTIDTARAQGATGFLAAAGRIELGDVVIESKNEYGSVLVVSLDGRPLRSSERILVQAATEDMPFGFATEQRGEYRSITNLGGYPLNVRRIESSIELRGAASRATVLSGTGHMTEREVQSRRSAGRLRITLPEDAIYTLLR